MALNTFMLRATRTVRINEKNQKKERMAIVAEIIGQMRGLLGKRGI